MFANELPMNFVFEPSQMPDAVFQPDPRFRMRFDELNLHR